MKYALYDSEARLPVLGGPGSPQYIPSRRFFAPPSFYYSIGFMGVETGGVTSFGDFRER